MSQIGHIAAIPRRCGAVRSTAEKSQSPNVGEWPVYTRSGPLQNLNELELTTHCGSSGSGRDNGFPAELLYNQLLLIAQQHP